MNPKVRWILVLFCNLLLIWLVGELNHGLAIWSLHVYLGGLLLVFGVFHLGLKQGLLANGLTALFLDAANPLPFGHTFILILVLHTILFSLRGNFARESLRSNLLIAISLNLILMTALGLFAAGGPHPAAAYWGRLGLDLLLSTIVLAVVAPWFLALQRTALAFAGVDLDAEQRETE